MHSSRRSQRRRLLRRARMCVGNQRRSVTICDASRRGMSIQTSPPPPHGTYVELLDVGKPVVGRVVWAEGNRCGLQLQDDLQQSVLASGEPADPHEAIASATANLKVSGGESVAFDRSRHMSRSIEFATALILAVLASTVLALIVYGQLSGVGGEMLSALSLR